VQALLSGGPTDGVDAFAASSLSKDHRTPSCRNFGRRHATGNPLSASLESKSGSDVDSVTNQIVVVLGGSGFIGRRVCKELVQASSDDEIGSPHRVVSISRNGKPPSWSLDNDSSWSDGVEWIKYDIGSESSAEGDSLVETLGSICQEIKDGDDESSPVEVTIVGCIGDVNPAPTWLGLWGLGFEDKRLFRDNGEVYDTFLEETSSLRDDNLLNIDRFVLLSIDYICQKCLEGPIEGYVDGKRLAERRFLEVMSETEGNTNPGGDETIDPRRLDDVIVIGLSSFAFGGKRFPRFGKFYRGLVESPVAKLYVKGNEALRSLSVGEDWVEAMLFSSPMDVEFAGKATAMAARGLVTRDLVNDGQPRKQGFFNTSGLPVEYDDVLFVDGTHEIEKLVGVLGGEKTAAKALSPGRKLQTKPAKPASSSSSPEPLWEGALIGKRPFLYPVPVTIFFVAFFWGVATQQFVQTVTPV